MMKKAMLVFIPGPGMGHFLSILKLTKLLMDINSNLSIAVLFRDSRVNPTASAEFDSIIASTVSARIKFINLPPPKIDKDAPLVKSLANFALAHKPSILEAVNNIVRDSRSPQLAGFVLDMFFASLNIDLANEFCVPSYLFYTSGAAALGFELYMRALHDEQKLNFAELQDAEIEFNVPSFVNPVSAKVFPITTLKPETFEMLHNISKHFREVKGIIVNTFSELEPHAVDSLSDGKQPTIYPVGPVLDLKSSSEVDHKYADIMEWLDGQPPSSVVFLCFGSMGSFDEDQVKEIACALVHSGHRFLWSLRRPPVKEAMLAGPTEYENVAGVLPEGFLDRTLGIGKIIGWAPQVAILGHPAIGGFVSHCGWNSILESIWFGVPIATWPLYSEQQLNAFEIVNELGIGVEITMDYRKHVLPVGGDDVKPEIVNAMKIERGIRCLMEQNSDVRKRVKEMSDKGRKALTEGGSSYSKLCRFINDIDVVNNMP